MAFVIETYRFTTICRSIVMIFALITLSSISQRFNRIHVKINKMMPTSVTRIVNVVVWKSAAKILSTYLWNFRLGQSIQQSHFAISWSFKLKSSWAKTFQQIELTERKKHSRTMRLLLHLAWIRSEGEGTRANVYSLEWSQTKLHFEN